MKRLLIFFMIIFLGASSAQTKEWPQVKRRLTRQEYNRESESIWFAMFTGQVEPRGQSSILFPDNKEYIEIGPIDLSVIRLELETNKKAYHIGEPIGIRQYIRNVSDQPISGVQFRSSCVYDPKFLILKDPRGNIVPQIFGGWHRVNEDKDAKNKETQRPFLQDWADSPFSLLESYANSPFSSLGSNKDHIRLQPGERTLVYKSGYGNDVLNNFFNLVQIGTYELTFCRRIVHEDDTIEVCDTPKPYTVTFEILPGFYSPEWPEEKKDADQAKEENSPMP